MVDENGIFKFDKLRFDMYDDHATETFNVLDYWHIILRQKRTVIFTCILVMLIGLPIIYALTPIYQSTAKIVVDGDQSKLVGLDVENLGGGNLDYKVNTEVEIIKSNKVHLRTIIRLQLWKAAEYNAVSLKEKLLSLFATEKSIPNNRQPKLYEELSGQEVMNYLEELNKNVSVSRTRRTNVIEISALSTSAEKAANIANDIAKSYLAEKTESKANSIREAADVLRNQLNKLSAEIQDYEHQVENFIQEQSNKVSSVEVRLELENLRKEIITRVGLKLAKTLQLSQIDRATISKNYSLLSEISNDENTISLYSKYQEISEQLKANSLNSSEKFNLTNELEKIDNDLSELAINLRNNINQGITDIQVKIDTVRNVRQKLFSDQNLPSDVSLALYRLTNDIESKRSLYETESSKYSEVEQKIGILIPDARVIAIAYPSPNPLKPNKIMLAVGLLIFAVISGLLFAIIRDKLIGGFTSSEQVKSVLGIRPLSIIPKHDEVSTKNIILESPLSRFSESIRMLRVGLENYKFGEDDTKSESRSRVIAITSTLPQEGKTTTALSLARSFSLAGSKTILIDLDFRHPALYERLGLEKSYGLQDFIREDHNVKKIDDLVYTEKSTKLGVLLSGISQKMATDILIQSELLDNILSRLKTQYDVIIIDTPPVGLVVDTQIIAQKVDQLVYAIRHASTSQKNVLTGINFINRAAENLYVTTIITQQDNSQAAYYGMYGAEYSYYYSG